MRTSEPLRPVIEEVEYLLAERRLLAAEGPHFIVTHGNHEHGTLCMPGETLEQVSMVCCWDEFPLHLSPAGLLIVDCLARYRRVSLTASRIARILASDPFYVQHGVNADGGGRKLVRPNRSSIKVHIQRIREQITKAFTETGITLDPYRILISETTDSNIVAYRLKASVEFRHREC